ncbi:hypothetical protein Bbelb_043370 [Branchiostoma belcheri]|nr:hypothetical protein Bbelb_043370 [Branchiostoma belcheri]
MDQCVDDIYLSAGTAAWEEGSIRGGRRGVLRAAQVEAGGEGRHISSLKIAVLSMSESGGRTQFSMIEASLGTSNDIEVRRRLISESLRNGGVDEHSGLVIED